MSFVICFSTERACSRMSHRSRLLASQITTRPDANINRIVVLSYMEVATTYTAIAYTGMNSRLYSIVIRYGCRRVHVKR